MATKIPDVYNDILDSDQFHNDDISVIGKPRPIPFGGHASTALNAVNFITVDREKAARRNLNYLHERIENEKSYQEKKAKEDALTGVV